MVASNNILFNFLEVPFIARVKLKHSFVFTAST